MISIGHISMLFFWLTMARCWEEHDKALLSQMQDWGKGIFKIIENNDRETAKGQYLVAALLPDSALDKPKELSKRLLRGCPEDGPDKVEKLMECSTSAVVLNKVSEETWKESDWNNDEAYKNHPWHGEYRLVRGGLIERLIKNFHEEHGQEANCRVYLYSFYIPCADIHGCPYSCSDLVAAYNNRGDIKCKITVIGYTEVFRRSKLIKTDETKAIEYIRNAQIDLFNTVKQVKLLAIQSVREKEPSTFQELMYTCLFESPLSGCCVDDSASRDNSKQVISYFINNMVFIAVNDRKLANKRFSKTTRGDLGKTFDKFIDSQVYSHCSRCPSAKYNAFTIQFCSKTALDLSAGFGSPTVPNDLSKPLWTMFTGSWKDLYRTSPGQFLNLRRIMCAHRSLSIESLCTKLPEQGKQGTQITLPTLKRDRPGSVSDLQSEFKLARIGE